MARHEVPDDQGSPDIPPLPESFRESLRRKLEQSGQSPTPVYRVGRDGTGHLEKPGEPTGSTMPTEMVEGDLWPLIRGIENMAIGLRQAIEDIPDIFDGENINPENFSFAVRLAFVHAGNALDYAMRLAEDVGQTRRIQRLRAELAREMRRAGLEGDPRDGMTPID